MEQGWSVTIDVVTKSGIEEAAVDELLECMPDRGIAASISRDRLRLSLTISVESREASSPASAVAVGESLFLGVSSRLGMAAPDVVAAEAMTFQEQDARLMQPVVPELVGVTEVAGLLGVSRQRASELHKRPGFPEPVALLAAGPVWTRSSIGNFEAAWSRRPGRPSRRRAS